MCSYISTQQVGIGPAVKLRDQTMASNRFSFNQHLFNTFYVPGTELIPVHGISRNTPNNVLMPLSILHKRKQRQVSNFPWVTQSKLDSFWSSHHQTHPPIHPSIYSLIHSFIHSADLCVRHCSDAVDSAVDRAAKTFLSQGLQSSSVRGSALLT